MYVGGYYNIGMFDIIIYLPFIVYIVGGYNIYIYIVIEGGFEGHRLCLHKRRTVSCTYYIVGRHRVHRMHLLGKLSSHCWFDKGRRADITPLPSSIHPRKTTPFMCVYNIYVQYTMYIYRYTYMWHVRLTCRNLHSY